MKYKKILGGVGAAAIALSLFGGCMANVNATETTLDVDVEEVLSVVFETAPANITFDEAGGFKTSTMTMLIESNSPSGVIATISTTASDANGSALKHTTSATDFIPSITSTVAKANFPANHWGFSVDGQTFQPMHSLVETPTILFTSTSNGDKASKTKTVYFGAKVDDTQFEGDYEAEIIITVLKNGA